MKYLIPVVLAALPAFFTAKADTNPVSDYWVGHDELGRVIPSSDNSSGVHTYDANVKIGMFYYVWHGTEASMTTVYDNTEILNANSSNPAWGPFGKYHWWGKPCLGYYNAGNKDVIRKHLQMLCDAGVDFLVLDTSNGLTYYSQVKALVDVIIERKNAGKPWPQLSFLTHFNQTVAITNLWNDFYSKSEYSDLWFRWQGNPLLLCDASAARADSKLTNIIKYLNLRHSWAWTGGQENTWSWLDHYPQGVGYTVTNNKRVYECISVSTAQHATTNIGKSYHNGSQPAVNAKGLCSETSQGLYFAEQWKRANELTTSRPTVVFITQWNENIAIRFRTGDSSGADPGKVRPGGKSGDSNESYFVDAYNGEYNRDIEPSTHPMIRDHYYMQMVENVRKYRGLKNSLPAPTCNIAINMGGTWKQWNSETLVYYDDRGDLQTSVAQNANDKSEGNDLVAGRVTQDNDNVYFYVETAAAIKLSNARSMRLMLNTDKGYSTGWNGYDFMVEWDATNKQYVLKKSTSTTQFSWSKVMAVDHAIDADGGTRLWIAIPKKDGLAKTGNFDIDFKWTDNVYLEANELLLMYTDGDCFPNGRFNLRYKGSRNTSTPIVVEASPSLKASTGEVSFSTPCNIAASSSITVSGSNLKGNVSVALSGANADKFSIDKTSLAIASGKVSANVKIDFDADGTPGDYSALLTLSSQDVPDVNVELSATAGDPQYYATELGDLEQGFLFSTNKGNLAEASYFKTDASTTVARSICAIGNDAFVLNSWAFKPDNVSVARINGLTGEYYGDLSLDVMVKTGVTNPLCALGAMGDVLLGCTRSKSNQTLYVYRWENGTNGEYAKGAMAKLFEDAEHGGIDCGGQMGVYGTFDDGKIAFSDGNKVVCYTLKNGSVVLPATVITLETAAGGDVAGQSVCFEADGSFWLTNKDHNPMHYSAAGKLIEEFDNSKTAEGYQHYGSQGRYIEYGEHRYLAMTVTLGSTVSTAWGNVGLRIVDITDGVGKAKEVAFVPAGGLGPENWGLASSNGLWYQAGGKGNSLARFWYLAPYQGFGMVYYDGLLSEPVSGVEGITADSIDDDNAPVEYYNLQGHRVSSENITPGLYIRRQGNRAAKILIR